MIVGMVAKSNCYVAELHEPRERSKLCRKVSCSSEAIQASSVSMLQVENAPRLIVPSLVALRRGVYVVDA